MTPRSLCLSLVLAIAMVIAPFVIDNAHACGPYATTPEMLIQSAIYRHLAKELSPRATLENVTVSFVDRDTARVRVRVHEDVGGTHHRRFVARRTGRVWSITPAGRWSDGLEELVGAIRTGVEALSARHPDSRVVVARSPRAGSR